MSAQATEGGCVPCQTARSTGGWGQEGTHCSRCHRSWRALGEAHCPTCCSHFTRPSAFDLHLLPRGCQDPVAVRTKAGEQRLKLVDRPSGPTWAGAGEWRGPQS